MPRGRWEGLAGGGDCAWGAPPTPAAPSPAPPAPPPRGRGSAEGSRASWSFPVLPCTSGVASEVCDLGLSCAGGDSRSVCPGCGPVPTGWAAVPRGDGGFPLSFVCPAGFLLSVNFGVLSILYFLPVHQHI